MTKDTTQPWPICQNSISDSWKSTELILEKMFEKLTQSMTVRKGAYRLYRHFSEQSEITPNGLAEALRNDIINVIPRYFELTEEETRQLQEHFARYHPAVNRTDLPGFYTWALYQTFAEQLPARN